MTIPLEVKKIKEFIESLSLSADYEEGGDKAKNFWIKIQVTDSKHIVIEYRPKKGYGCSFLDWINDDIGYGDGCDEIRETEESVIEYIQSKLN